MVTEDDDAVCCEVCDNWYHKQCGVSDALFLVLNSHTDNAHWFCGKCNFEAVGLEKDIIKLQANVQQIEDKVDKCSQQMSQIDRTLTNFQKEANLKLAALESKTSQAVRNPIVDTEKLFEE